MIFIPGMFDFADLYDRAADMFDDCTFVEVGCWQGSSTAHLCKKVQDKNIRVVVIDVFTGALKAPHQHAALTRGNQFDSFMYNMDRCGFEFKDYEKDPSAKFTYLKGDSKEKLHEVTNGDVKFLFLDGSHEHSQVQREIEIGLGLLNPPAVIAGHDYDLRGCRKAVNSRLGPENIEIFIGRNVLSWWVQL